MVLDLIRRNDSRVDQEVRLRYCRASLEAVLAGSLGLEGAQINFRAAALQVGQNLFLILARINRSAGGYESDAHSAGEFSPTLLLAIACCVPPDYR